MIEVKKLSVGEKNKSFYANTRIWKKIIYKEK